MDRASRTLRGIFNNGTSPSFCVWAHGGIDASEIVQQVLDGYAFDRVRTQRLIGGSMAARSAMTFALTGGETGEARLLDLLFCLVTPHHPHRIHHCCMARTRRRPPDSHPLLHHFRLRLSSHLLPLLISMLELLRLSMLELLRLSLWLFVLMVSRRLQRTPLPLALVPLSMSPPLHPRVGSI